MKQLTINTLTPKRMCKPFKGGPERKIAYSKNTY